jgi:hypothetical protein
MANYSEIFPLGGSGINAVNTLLLLRPVDNKIIDLVTGYSPTEMYFYTSSANQNGKIEISTSPAKFDKSIYIYRAILNTLGNHFYNNDFTIECWYRMQESTIPTSFNTLFARTGRLASTALQTFYMGFSPTNFGLMASGVGGIDYNVLTNASPLGFVLNQFNHFAVVRHNNKLACFLNGVKRIESVTVGDLIDVNSLTVDKMSNGLAIGGGWFNIALNQLDSRCRNGWYEEIRVSKVARYTANFTPYDSPFILD